LLALRCKHLSVNLVSGNLVKLCNVGRLLVLSFRPEFSGLAVLEKRRRLFVIVDGDEIVVTSDAGFRAAYCRRPHHPQLIIRRRTDTDDHEVIAQAWQAANDKARELGWIGTPITHFPVKRRRP
jgi:hypothetical protein